MTTAPVQTAGRQRWVCDDCGGAFVWGEQSYWYGSWRAVDDCDWAAIDVYCGTCRHEPLVPEFSNQDTKRD